jgi:hypothetical protein
MFNSRHCERSEAIHGSAKLRDGLLRRGARHRAALRADPLAPRNDELRHKNNLLDDADASSNIEL